MRYSLILFFLGLLLAPLLPGVINRVKAVFGGRRGQPLLQTYFDLFKLLRKGAVYSRTTTWVFRAGPVVGLAAAVVALAITPLGGGRALAAFPGDFLLLTGLLALLRFATVAAALDTGSSFEGMGASRECLYGALAEPALLLALLTFARLTSRLSLSGMFARLDPPLWTGAAAIILLAAAALMMVFLAENARIPFDDPNTHLELTMIHEVMVLDHSGPDFALITYTASLKLWILGALLVNALVPARQPGAALSLAAGVAGLFALAALTGVIESVMARLRLSRVPQILIGAGALSALALLFALR